MNLPDLDGMTRDELIQFAAKTRRDIADFDPALFEGRDSVLAVTERLAQYAATKANAMLLRATGYIPDALRLEGKCETIYQQLPSWARW